MAPLTCVILDDEPPAVQLLTAYAERAPGLEVTASFTSAVEALHFLSDHPVDVLFLDVQIPDLTGMQLLKILRDPPQIVLTTAYEEYAVRGYEFEVTDYLLKPVPLDRFLLAVERVRKRAGSGAATAPTPEPTTPSAEPDYFFVKSGHKTVRVPCAELVRLESMSNYVLLHLTSGERVMTLENMGALVGALPQKRFVRIHRSHAVALDKIDYIERNRVVIGAVRLPISEGYRDEFWARVKR